jgi:hypothetical protein
MAEAIDVHLHEVVEEQLPEHLSFTILRFGQSLKFTIHKFPDLTVNLRHVTVQMASVNGPPIVADVFLKKTIM